MLVVAPGCFHKTAIFPPFFKADVSRSTWLVSNFSNF